MVLAAWEGNEVMIWLLILFTITAGEVDTKMVEKYPDHEECDSERLRIKKEFLKSYPNDNSWAFKCVPAEVKVPDSTSSEGESKIKI
jgi:hypothetical protein